MHNLGLCVNTVNTITFNSNPNNISNNKKQSISSAEKNPVTRKGEAMNLIKATFVAGLGIGARLLFEIFDGDFVFETASEQGEKLAKKARKNASSSKLALLTIGATGALIVAGISGFALLYTMYKAPKIAYDSKVNSFKKGKEMDVYIKSNEAEKELYTQLGKKAANSTPDDKERLKEQYMQMQMAKNQVPDFIKLK